MIGLGFRRSRWRSFVGRSLMTGLWLRLRRLRATGLWLCLTGGARLRAVSDGRPGLAGAGVFARISDRAAARTGPGYRADRRAAGPDHRVLPPGPGFGEAAGASCCDPPSEGCWQVPRGRVLRVCRTGVADRVRWLGERAAGW